jgi:hypothetical protein
LRDELRYEAEQYERRGGVSEPSVAAIVEYANYALHTPATSDVSAARDPAALKFPVLKLYGDT